MNYEHLTDGERCGAVYEGPTFPAERGVKCFMPKGHDSGPPHGMAQHVGYSIACASRKPMSWYSREQKKARAKET